jgi:hypothetical protein
VRPTALWTRKTVATSAHPHAHWRRAALARRTASPGQMPGRAPERDRQELLGMLARSVTLRVCRAGGSGALRLVTEVQPLWTQRSGTHGISPGTPMFLLLIQLRLTSSRRGITFGAGKSQASAMRVASRVMTRTSHHHRSACLKEPATRARGQSVNSRHPLLNGSGRGASACPPVMP